MDPPPAPFSRNLKVDKSVLNYLTKAHDGIIRKLKTTIDNEITNLKPYPSDYHLAFFANEIYEDTFNTPDGWELLIKVTNTSLGNGYVGAAFFNSSQQQIIIAHRGTKSLSAWWTNLISVVKNSSSPQICSALTFADFIRSVILKLQSEKRWRYQLSFTGHSLGGFLAQVTTFGVKYLKRHNDLFLKSKDVGIHSHCVSFDNPGCAEMLEQLTDDCDLRYLRTIFPSTLDITAYLSAPNKVNMCNHHVGILLRLKLSFEEMGYWSAETPLYHKKTHDMDKIKSVFLPDEVTIKVDVHQIFDWPVSIVISNEEYKNYFKSSKKETDFHPDIKTTLVYTGEGCFSTIRYRAFQRHSIKSCNVSLFSEDELFLLKHWLKIVQSPITINEEFLPLKHPFKDLFHRFERIGDDLIFRDETSMRETIKRCKQIVRWYPDEIKKCLSSLLLKSQEVIMQVAVDSYNESFNNCKVNFNDSIGLEKFLGAKENVLIIKPSVKNYKIETLRLFNILKQIRNRNENTVKNNEYIGKDCFLFVNQSYLLTLFKYTELDLIITSGLKLLIVDLLNETVKDDVLKLINRFAIDDRKVVIVTTSKINLILTNGLEIPTPDFAFTDLTVESQSLALNYNIIMLQNKSYSLATFLNATPGNETNNLPFLYDHQFLDLLQNDHHIELKNDSLNLSNLENFYIQTDREQDYSYNDFAKLIVNSDCDLNKSRILITHACDHLNLQIPCDTLQTTDLNEALQYFKSKCKEASASKFYWFHYDEKVSLKQIYNPQLYIPRSFYYEMVLDLTNITDSIKEDLLRQEKESNQVNIKLTTSDNESLDYSFRVNRKKNKVTYVWDGSNNNEISVIRDLLAISHDGSLGEGDLVNRRVVLITGDPGIGKSTTVTNLISKIDNSWVFKLTYNDCMTIVTRLNDKFEVDEISKHLLKVKSIDQFDFLKYHLAHKTPIKVVLLFDEIFDSLHDQDNENRIIKFLQFLCDKTESLVIITARDTRREMIENALKIFSIQFKQFNREHIEGYLTKYWSELYHLDVKLNRLTLKGLKDYASRLLQNAEEIFDQKILSFIGIPLQIKLLAEIAAPDFASLSKKSVIPIPLLLPGDLTEMFEAFVRKKLAIVCNKSRLAELYSIKQVFLDSIDKKLRIFSAYKFNFYAQFDELETLQHTGLIQGSEFVHPTIQEFYFARQIFAWLKKCEGRHPTKRPKLEEFLLKKIFLDPAYRIVRMFLEKYIASITPEDSPFYSGKIVEMWIDQQHDIVYYKNLQSPLHRLILEHCQGTVIFLLESLTSHCEIDRLLPLLIRTNKFNQTILCLACEVKQTIVIDYLIRFLEAQSKEIQDQIIITSFYRLPNEKCENALDNFITRIPPSSSLNDITDYIISEIGLINDLTLAAQNGSLEDVKDCLNKVNKTIKPYLLSAAGDNKDCDNALNLSVKNNYPEIVRLLIEHGSSVNQENFYSMTPIARASQTGNCEILRYLVENGGDYDIAERQGITPFHRAAARGDTVMVKYFLEELKYKGLHLTDAYGNTALYRAVRNKKREVVEILLRQGIDVDAANRYGMRALDAAVKVQDMWFVKAIVQAGAIIDYRDRYGMSPIDEAEKSGRKDIVKYLKESREKRREILWKLESQPLSDMQF